MELEVTYSLLNVSDITFVKQKSLCKVIEFFVIVIQEHSLLLIKLKYFSSYKIHEKLLNPGYVSFVLLNSSKL